MMMMMIIKWQTGIPSQDEAEGQGNEWSSRFGPIILFPLAKATLSDSELKYYFVSLSGGWALWYNCHFNHPSRWIDD